MWFSEDGEIRDTKVYIIWGAPASGKTTYVRGHMSDGDLVVDIDSIRNALTMNGEHSESGNLLNVILEVRETIYKMIANREIQCRNVWIISLLPKYTDREELADRLGGQLIHIATDRQECLRRMETDSLRTDKQQQTEIINKYFRDLEI